MHDSHISTPSLSHCTFFCSYLFYYIDLTFNETCSILQNAGVEYTILKYGDMRPMAEAKYPYRVMRGGLAIPTEGQGLSNGDLWRIIAELVDLPKSFNNVYSVGSGMHTSLMGILVFYHTKSSLNLTHPSHHIRRHKIGC